MATYRIFIPAAWKSAAVDALRAAYVELATRLAKYVEARPGEIPDEWVPRTRARLEEIGGALDQVGWNGKAGLRSSRAIKLQASGATIGIALAGVLREIAQLALRGDQPEFEEDPRLLDGDGLVALITLLSSVKETAARS